MMGLSMLRNIAEDAQRAWLHETTRLLSDLPGSLLLDAIDDCLKHPGRVFPPTVGEIREKIAAPLQRAELEAANLRRLATAIADGVEIPEYEEPKHLHLSGEPIPPKPAEVCSPQAARAILEEFGLRGPAADKLAATLDAERPKSRAEMIAAGEVPPLIQTPESDSWRFMP